MELHYQCIGNEIFRNTKRAAGTVIQMVLSNVNQNTALFDGNSLVGKRIAVIGNAPMCKSYGKEIDLHDIIIRCNKGLFSPGINPEIAGTKTHICFAGAVSVLMNTRFRSILSDNPEVTLVAPFSCSEKEVAFNRLISQLLYKNGIHYLSNEYMKKILGLTSPGMRPSTGFIASNIAIQQSPGNVSLYGFTFSDFNRIENKRSYTTQHNFLDEKRYIMGLQNEGLLYARE